MPGPPETNVRPLLERFSSARSAAIERHRIEPPDEIARALCETLDERLRSFAGPFIGVLGDEAAILAVGRYGRRHLGVHSRIPILLLLRERPEGSADEAVRTFLASLPQGGTTLSVQVRCLPDLPAALMQSPTLAVTLAGSRLIHGNPELHSEVARALRVAWGGGVLLSPLLRSVLERHARHGGTPFLLEPDLRQSPGGVEDAELPMVLSALLGREATIDGAVAAGIVAPAQRELLHSSHGGVLEFRNGLHLLEGGRIDELRYERQMRLSAEWAQAATESALPEENLMRAWYACADPIHEIAGRALRAAQEVPGVARVLVNLTRPLQSGFILSGGEIDLDPAATPVCDGEGSWAMELFAAAAEHRLGLSDRVCLFIERQLLASERFQRSPRNRQLFFSVLRCPDQAPRVLRLMHRTRALESYLPEFAAVRHLPKIDHYHQFTLDEHILRAVDAAGRYCSEDSDLVDTHGGKIAQSLLRPDLLLLAALLHDTGKGVGRAHVIRGARIAEEVAGRMRLSAREGETIRQLILNHHRMSHIALKRNLDEDGVREELANDLPDTELLAMLYVLTCCDIRAVSSTAWNEWRGCLLARLYDAAIATIDERLGKLREDDLRHSMLVRVLDVATSNPDDEAIPPLNHAAVASFLHRFSESYRLTTPERHVARHLAMSLRLTPVRPMVFEVHPAEGEGALTLHVVCEDTPGLLRQLSGAVHATGFRFSSAHCYTSRDRRGAYVFHLVPWEAGDDLPRILEGTLRRVAENVREKEQIDWTLPGEEYGPPASEALMQDRPPEVTITNGESRDGTTTVQVSAPARAGFLFRICRALDDYRTHIAGVRLETEDYVTVATLAVTDWENNRLVLGPKTEGLREALLLAAAPPRTFRSSTEVRKL